MVACLITEMIEAVHFSRSILVKARTATFLSAETLIHSFSMLPGDEMVTVYIRRYVWNGPAFQWSLSCLVDV